MILPCPVQENTSQQLYQTISFPYQAITARVSIYFLNYAFKIQNFVAWYTSASIQGWTAIAISSDGRIQAATTNDGYIYVAFYFGLSEVYRILLVYFLIIIIYSLVSIRIPSELDGYFPIFFRNRPNSMHLRWFSIFFK